MVSMLIVNNKKESWFNNFLGDGVEDGSDEGSDSEEVNLLNLCASDICMVDTAIKLCVTYCVRVCIWNGGLNKRDVSCHHPGHCLSTSNYLHLELSPCKHAQFVNLNS
jgi:hypothetical protein